MFETNLTDIQHGPLNAITELLCRFGLDLTIILLIVGFIYYPRHKNKDFLFTFIIFNISNFIICYLLANSKLNMGFAFGLFAIFSIIRYRTVMVPIREMGYFFISVALGLINALSSWGDVNSIVICIISNIFFVMMVFILDKNMGLDHENNKIIQYEKIENIKPENYENLLEDLRNRTGLPVHRAEILKIDFLRDIARIQAFYYSKKSEGNYHDYGNEE